MAAGKGVEPYAEVVLPWAGPSLGLYLIQTTLWCEYLHYSDFTKEDTFRVQGGWESSRTWGIKASNHRVRLVLVISKGVEKRGCLGVKVERRTDWEVDSCLTSFELKLQAEGIDKWKWVEDNGKSRSGLGWCIRAGEIDLEVISPSQGIPSHPRSSPVGVSLPQENRFVFQGWETGD